MFSRGSGGRVNTGRQNLVRCSVRMVWLASFLFVGALGCAEGPTTSEEPAVEAPLFGPEPVCPTAPERATLSWFVWRTTRQLDGIVWSSDGRQIGAAELVF